MTTRQTLAQRLRRDRNSRGIRLCEVCGRSPPPMLDREGWLLQDAHIVPRSQGGTDEPSNRMMMCAWCHALLSAHEHLAGKVFVQPRTPEQVKRHIKSIESGNVYRKAVRVAIAQLHGRKPALHDRPGGYKGNAPAAQKRKARRQRTRKSASTAA